MNETKQPPYRPRPISGFPEWLPEARLVELRWLKEIQAAFESYGFCSIETPSVEETAVLASKGADADKEIYGVRRLQSDGSTTEPRIALHYDLTVPLARYVAQHYNDLVFPFKRYQIQRAWRGERPQDGRFREFSQCDLDIIDNDSVSIQFDAELPAIVYDILQRLGVGRVSLHINNRKILGGFYGGLGIGDIVSAIRIVDKMDKIGPEQVARLLVDELSLPVAIADKCIALAAIRVSDRSFVERIRSLGISSPLLDEGLQELDFVISNLAHVPPGVIYADLSIARGFDYYTGTVYEGKLVDYPTYPSICSGGRYDNLVGTFMKRQLPGVGISIGLTRIFSKLLNEGLIPLGAKCPTLVLVAFHPGTDREVSARTARQLRARGFNVEMYHEPKKLDHQLRYASRKGIRYVWFPGSPDGRPDEVKDLNSGGQVSASAEMWQPA